jgi:hypothetical protein
MITSWFMSAGDYRPRRSLLLTQIVPAHLIPLSHVTLREQGATSTSSAGGFEYGLADGFAGTPTAGTCGSEIQTTIMFGFRIRI